MKLSLKNIKALDNITVRNILKEISQYQIFKKYSRVFSLNRTVISDLRVNDSHPSLSFYKTKSGKIRFKDFGGHSGDCFDYVMIKFKINFRQALQKINDDFNLKLEEMPIVLEKKQSFCEEKKIKAVNQKKVKSHINNSILSNKINFDTGIGFSQKSKLSWEHWNTDDQIIRESFVYQIEDFDSSSLDWWNSMGINKNILQFFNVYQCKHYSLLVNDERKYKISAIEESKIYAYLYASGELKFYSPHNRNWKFRGNATNEKSLQGTQNFSREMSYQNKPPLIITKSLKDVMCLYGIGNYHAVAFQSESYIINDEIINYLRKYYGDIYILYDNDYTGVKYSNINTELHNLKQMFIPDITRCKDISEFTINNSEKEAKKLIDKLIYDANRKYNT